MAIAITDAIHEKGLRPMSPLLVGLRGLFRVEMPSSALDLADQALHARRGTAGTVGCVGLFGLFVLPVLVPIEIVRAFRVRRHTAAVARQIEASRPFLVGYRENASTPDPFRTELLAAQALYAIDWTIWRDGTACFAGSALGVVRGDEHAAHWITVHRGGALPADTVDASRIVRALSGLPALATRWEWDLADPFEAVERA